MLKFDNTWRFDSPGAVRHSVVEEFFSLILKTSRGEQRILEHFKEYFAKALGFSSLGSSNASWAETDLQKYMTNASKNAPVFIEAFYDGCVDLAKSEEGLPVPGVDMINRILQQHENHFQIVPPDLVRSDMALSVAPPEIPATLDQRAQDVIQSSISQSQTLLTEGRYRQAVQEVIWLLETVSTVFQGFNTGNNLIEGDYFNKIIGQLRQHNRGTSLDQISRWIINLHGYLSSPAGGGIRHGMHLRDGEETPPGEAKLYCNLIISYISFLLSEYERLNTAPR